MGYYNPDRYYTAGPDVAYDATGYEPTTYEQEVYDLAKKLGNMTAEQCLAVADALISGRKYWDTDNWVDGDDFEKALKYVERRLNTKIGGV